MIVILNNKCNLTKEEFSNYLEDTVFCNNRTIRSKNGWEPNGGNTMGNLRYKEYDSTKDLACENETDRFSTLNNKAKLTYPVGLASNPEVNLFNNRNIRKQGKTTGYIHLVFSSVDRGVLPPLMVVNLVDVMCIATEILTMSIYMYLMVFAL